MVMSKLQLCYMILAANASNIVGKYRYWGDITSQQSFHGDANDASLIA